MTPAGYNMSARWATRAAYAACGWTMAYGPLKLYWVLGGTALVATLGLPEELLRNPWFVVLGGWGTVALAVLGALIALALVRPWGRRVSRWILLIPAWTACVLLVVQGGGRLVQDALAVGGVIDVPESVDRTVIHWHLMLWDPFFLVGGLSWGAAAWYFTRGSQRETSGGHG